MEGVMNWKRKACLFYIFLIFLPFFNDGYYELVVIFTLGVFPFFPKKFNLFHHSRNLKKVKYFFLITSTLYIFFQYNGLRNIEGASLFLGTLFVLKLWEEESKRDTFLFLLIGLLFMVSKFLIHQTPLFLFYLIIISFLFLFMTSFTSMADAREKEKEDRDMIKNRIREIRTIFIASVPLSILLFIFFPRIHLHLPFGGPHIPIAQTGFSQGIKPGDFESLISNKDEVFKAHFKGPSPNYNKLYWRGVTLTSTDGFSWRRPITPIKRSSYKRRKKLFEYTLEYENLEKSPLFTLPWSIINYHSPGRLKRESGFTFSLSPRRNVPLQFRATNYVVDFDNLSPNEKRNYLQLPSSIGLRTKRLAESLKGETPQKTISNIIDHFRNNNFFFDLSPGRYQKENPLEEFLFERKRGYCEHFASSMAILLRLNKIPTRLVGGFMGGTYNTYGKYYIVRNEDAHAWPEVWINKSWQNADPTPTLAPTRVNFGANTYFFNFLVKDSSIARSKILQRAQMAWRELGLQLDFIYYKFDHFFSLYNFSGQNHFLKPFFNLFPHIVRANKLHFLMFLILIFVFIFISFLTFKTLVLESQSRNDLEKSFNKLCKKLKQSPKKGEGPLAFKERLEIDEQLTKKVFPLIDFYISAKYSPSSISQTQLKEFTNKINDLKA